MIKDEILSFSDFLGSILSFWMTLLAMAEISPGLRSIGHIVGFLGIAIGVEYRRNGVWAFAAPAGLGLIIMIVSWVRIKTLNSISQWLSGSVLESRPRGCVFEFH